MKFRGWILLSAHSVVNKMVSRSADEQQATLPVVVGFGRAVKVVASRPAKHALVVAEVFVRGIDRVESETTQAKEPHHGYDGEEDKSTRDGETGGMLGLHES